MAIDDQDEIEEGQTKDKKSTSGGLAAHKHLLITVGVALLVALITVPVTVLVVRPSAGDSEASLDADAAIHAGEVLLPEGADDEDLIDEDYELLGAVVPLETFLVNLAQGGYLRIQIQIEFEDRDVPARFYNQLVPIRDGIILLLTQKTASELRSLNGKQSLRNEVRDLVNGLLRRVLVKRVYFTQFVIQSGTDAG